MRGRSDASAVWFASEAKGLLGHCNHFEPFMPGTFYAARRRAEQAS